MNEKEKKQKQIQLLQQNLRSIRKIAGWTAEQLGDRIGVTKQTIGNLENSKTPMNLTQYIAIRSVFGDEIKSNTVLEQVIDILVDKGAELEEENYSEIKEKVDVVAASASSGKKGESLANIFLSLMTTPRVIGALTALGITLSQSDIVAKATAFAKKTLK